MFHKVVWQYMQGVVGSLVTIFVYKFTQESSSEKIS